MVVIFWHALQRHVAYIVMQVDNRLSRKLHEKLYVKLHPVFYGKGLSHQFVHLRCFSHLVFANVSRARCAIVIIPPHVIISSDCDIVAPGRNKLPEGSFYFLNLCFHTMIQITSEELLA